MMQTISQQYRAAIYLRLSKEDGDSFLSGKQESDSIGNQRELIRHYLKEHPEIIAAREFVDDGYTGTNFDRPDFQRMMGAVRSGEINCILVKDLSRFGRDYVESGKYLEKIFPQLGIRFIAVNDRYDSGEPASMADSMILPFRNLINDSYSRDTSMKTRTNLDAMRRSGHFVANFTVYGYLRDPEDKHRMIVDEQAAPVVRDIFRWKIEGWSIGRIAAHLSGLGILPPSGYKRANGIRHATPFGSGAQAAWSYVAVKRILSNEVYTGVLVQGKRTTPNYKVKKSVCRKESEWARVEGTHEAIIPRSQYDLVQQLLLEDTRTRPEGTAVPLFAGRIFCKRCGSTMTRKTVNSGVKKYIYYVCSANKKDRKSCSSQMIAENQLEAAVLATVQAQVQALLDMDKALENAESLCWERRELDQLTANIARQEGQIRKCERLKLDAYTDFKDGLLTREEFWQLKESYSGQIAAAQEAIRCSERGRQHIRECADGQQGWLAQFRQYRGLRELTRPVVVHLIEHILVSQDKQIEVRFRQRDQFEGIRAFLQGQEGKVI